MNAPPVRYVKTSDGYDIAFAVSGASRDLVLTPQPVSHIQTYWTEETFVRPWLRGLAGRFRLIQYDGRGQGMSSRGLKPGHAVQDEVRDLEAVVERLGLDRFVLLSQGHVAVLYAVAHPERLDALVLVGLTASGVTWPANYLVDLAENDWATFVRSQSAFANAPEPLASERRMMQSISQEDWLLRTRAFIASDISELLPGLQVPTLVLQVRDRILPSFEECAKLVGAIPGARMTVIDGVTPLGDAEQGIDAIGRFLLEAEVQEEEKAKGARTLPPAHLSSRELEVLRLLAAGRSNPQIAAELIISSNTVAKHVTRILSKTRTANRTEAAAYAHRHGIA